MAKLTKTEINALALDIQSELTKERQEQVKEENEAAEVAFYQTDTGKIIKHLLSDEETAKLINKREIQNFAGHKYVSYPNLTAIERKLIIAQISSQDIESMVASVKASFQE